MRVIFTSVIITLVNIDNLFENRILQCAENEFCIEHQTL